MTSPNPIAERFIAQLNDWLTNDLLYHCFSSETDQDKLDHVGRLPPSLAEPLLNKAEREWPDRLRLIEVERKREDLRGKAAVKQFVLDFPSHNKAPHDA